MEAFNIEDQAAILARSTQLSAQHREYLAKHPALTELMHDFLTNVLVNKPDDCYQFCQEYFAGFVGGDGTGDVREGWAYRKCRALLIVGPSGAGKSWLAKKLVSLHEDKFGRVISHTTRPPRDREVDRDDYVFTDREAVEIGREGGEYLSVVDIEGEIYGTMRDRVTAVQSLGRVPVISCTVDGALLLRKAMAGDFMPRCILLKPSGTALQARLSKLGLSKEVEESRLRALTSFQDTLKMRPGLFDLEFEAQYAANAVDLSEACVDKIKSCLLAENWEAKVDHDQAKAALKIQGQARRQRDSRKVHAIKDSRRSQHKEKKAAGPAQ